jgi:hypothetical protein
LDFYSPSRQKAILIIPNMPTVPASPDHDLDESIGFVDWGDKLAIPNKFLSLTDAVRKAQQKGMRAPSIKSATLTNSQGTSTGDEDTSGLKWELEPVFGQRYYVDAKVPDDAASGK